MTATTILTSVKQCAKCGTAKRNDHGRCKFCAKAYASAYYAANPEKAKAANARYHAKNPSKRKAIVSAWKAANQDKVKAAAAAWRTANPDKARAASAAYNAANKGKVAARQAAYRAANPDKVKANSVAWRAANPEAHRIHEQNRNARKRANSGVLSVGLSADLFKLQRGKCACCGKPLGADFQLDHIMPIALGGLNVDSNIQLLRRRCNQQKRAAHPVDFMQSRGLLL